MAITIANWDFQSKHVQDLDVFHGANYLSSESIVMCAVPWADTTAGTGTDAVTTTSADTSPTSWIPIGLLESIQVLQNKQLQNLFEIGSRKMINIPGRTMKRVNLSRIMFNGPSLLKATTRFNLKYGEDANTIDALEGHDKVDTFGSLDEPAYNINAGKSPFSYSKTADLFIDIASSFFNSPMNLGMVFKDSEDDEYGAFILTETFVQSHQFSLTGQQTVVMENVSLVIGDIVPVGYGKDGT